MKNTEFEPRNRTTLVTFLALLLIVMMASLWMTAPFLMAITVGGLLAIVSDPLYKRLLKRGLWPKAAAGLVAGGIVLLIILPILVFGTLAIKQGIAIGNSLSDKDHLSFQALVEKVMNLPLIDMLGISSEELISTSREWAAKLGGAGTAFVVQMVANIPDIILQLTLATIACFFFLLDGQTFLKWMHNKVPLENDVRRKVVISFKQTAIDSIWATLAAGAAQSLVIFLAYVVLGVPAAFLAAGATFIFAWIPILGSIPAWVIGAIYLYAQDSPGKMVGMVIFGLIAGVADNVVRPLILRGRSDMHPLVGLVAIFGGIALFGILGVFIGPILIAVMISVLQIWPDVAERFGLAPAEAN